MVTGGKECEGERTRREREGGGEAAEGQETVRVMGPPEGREGASLVNRVRREPGWRTRSLRIS